MKGTLAQLLSRGGGRLWQARGTHASREVERDGVRWETVPVGRGIV
jgi:hypothetical protein